MMIRYAQKIYMSSHEFYTLPRSFILLVYSIT